MPSQLTLHLPHILTGSFPPSEISLTRGVVVVSWCTELPRFNSLPGKRYRHSACTTTQQAWDGPGICVPKLKVFESSMCILLSYINASTLRQGPRSVHPITMKGQGISSGTNPLSSGICDHISLKHVYIYSIMSTTQLSHCCSKHSHPMRKSTKMFPPFNTVNPPPIPIMQHTLRIILLPRHRLNMVSSSFKSYLTVLAAEHCH